MSIDNIPISTFLVYNNGQPVGQYLGLDFRGNNVGLEDGGNFLQLTISGGSSSVADDVARTVPGGPIDRVEGFYGVPLDGAVSGIGDTYYYDGNSFARGRVVPGGWIDVTHHGVVADATLGVIGSGTDQRAAIQAIIDAAPEGSVIYFPRGVYRVGSNAVASDGAQSIYAGLILWKRVYLQGCGYNSYGSILQLDSGASIKVYASITGAPYPLSSAQGSVIRDVGIFTAKLLASGALPSSWTPSTAITAVGTRRRVYGYNWGYLEALNTGTTAAQPGSPFAASSAYVFGDIVNDAAGDAADPPVYFYCLTGGTSGGAAPTWNTTPWSITVSGTVTFYAVPGGPNVPASLDIFSMPFEASKQYYLGEVVRAPSGTAASPPVFFQCVTAGISGGSAPTWDTTVGNTTTSGAAVFIARNANESWVLDGSVVWAGRAHSCIHTRTRVRVSNVYVDGSFGPGVHCRGNDLGVLGGNVNGTVLDNVRSVQCGIGLMMHGNDANTSLIMGCDVESAGFGIPGNGGFGCYDSGGSGNTWVMCQVANDPTQGGGHSICADGSTSRSVWIGCYAEGFSGDTRIRSHIPQQSAAVYGGNYGGGFTDNEYPAQDIRLFSASGNNPPGANRITNSLLIFPVTDQKACHSLAASSQISPAVDTDASGAVASLASIDAVGNVTITGITGANATDASRYITISGAANPANNGEFEIGTFVNANSVIYNNPNVGATAPDANNGSISWSIGGGHVYSFLGRNDFNGHALGWQGPRYANNIMGIAYSPVLTSGFPDDWWTIAYNGDSSKVSIAFPGPNAKYPSGATLGEFSPWVLNRLFIGPKTTNPPSVDFGLTDPATASETRAFATGSIRFNLAPASASPMGWTCTAGGSPGTWAPLANVP